jgi:adenylate cyclase
MTDYNGALARCVTTRGGLALPPHGDGFVSLWALGARLHHADATIRLAACHAALEMTAAADRFNEARADDERLPLRLGLTVGEVTIRSDADRGAFEAVGDAVNIAARLQEANRSLGTAVLASADLVVDLPAEILLRRIEGPLRLKGVERTSDVFELKARTVLV